MGSLGKSLAIFISLLCCTVPAICDVDDEIIGELSEALDNQTRVVDEIDLACEKMESRLEELEGAAAAEKAAELSRRVDSIMSSLEALDSRLSNLGNSDIVERTAEMRGRADNLVEESERLKDRVESCREEIILRSNSPGDDVNGLSGMIDMGTDRLSNLVVAVSQKLKSSFSTISSTLGGILGSISQIEAGTVEARGPNPLAVAVLTLGLAAALGGTSYLIQNYWSGGFSTERMFLSMRSKLGLGSPEIFEETSSTLSIPFWDPVPKIDGDQKRVSPVDQEYIRTLLKLGYIEEARVVMNSLEGEPSYTPGAGHQIRGSEAPRIGIKRDRKTRFSRLLGPFSRITGSNWTILGSGVISQVHRVFDAFRRREG